ncbi:MAG: hypothetical protein ABII06_19065, partial [Pseudomonadota bacterium]
MTASTGGGGSAVQWVAERVHHPAQHALTDAYIRLITFGENNASGFDPVRFPQGHQKKLTVPETDR